MDHRTCNWSRNDRSLIFLDFFFFFGFMVMGGKPFIRSHSQRSQMLTLCIFFYMSQRVQLSSHSVKQINLLRPVFKGYHSIMTFDYSFNHLGPLSIRNSLCSCVPLKACFNFSPQEPDTLQWIVNLWALSLWLHFD